MSAEIAHSGLVPTVGERFTDKNGIEWIIRQTDQSTEKCYSALLKEADGGFEDWFSLTSEMLVAYALTRRPA